jgi:hypothetical protein
MATAFPVTQNQIIIATMLELGALDQSSQPNPYDYSNISFALNLLLKTWMASGIALWKVSTLQLPFVANNQTYYIGPSATGPGALVTDRVLRVTEAEIVNNSSLQSIDLWPLAREQFVELSGKFTSFGVPTQYWFEPLGSELNSPNSRISFYPIPADTTFTAYLKALQPLTNAVNLSDVIDFPSEYYWPFIKCLSYELANQYPVSSERYARIEKRAIGQLELIEDWGQEQDVEVRIKFDRRGH